MYEKIYQNAEMPNVFNDIVEYLKAQTADHSKNEYSCEILSQVQNDENPNLVNKSFIITYDAIEKDLYFQGKNDDVDFICIFNALDDYSKNPSKIYAHLQDTNSDNTPKIYTARVDLPATANIDMQSTLPLPEFKDVTGNPSKEIIKTFRNQLSILLNEYLHELNNFYVQKIKNGDTKYTGLIYQFFYLPIIQIENH